MVAGFIARGKLMLSLPVIRHRTTPSTGQPGVTALAGHPPAPAGGSGHTTCPQVMGGTFCPAAEVK